MGNPLKMKGAFAAAAILAASAQAQSPSNSQFLTSPLVEKASAADIEKFLQPLGIAVAPFEDGQADTYTIMATTETGGQFLVTMFDCADATAGADCQGFTAYAGFSNAGFAYDDLNRFNTESSVSKAINIASQNAVIFGVQQFLTGGVSPNNMQFVTVLFLNDLNKFMTAQDVNGTSVSLSLNERGASQSKAPSKTNNRIIESDPQTLTPFGNISLSGAIASAINNTADVRFDALTRE